MGKSEKSKKAYRMMGKRMEVYNISTQKETISWWSIFKWTIFFILIGLLSYFAYTTYGVYWKIEIHQANNYTEHYLWSLINAGLLGGFLIAIYNSDGYSSWKIKVILVIAVIVIAILGIERLGLLIWLNFDFLRYKTIITNGVETINFMFLNLDFLTIIFGTSFLIESNK